ncbi:MAG: hypothetical protein H6Q00_2191 [Holophagaceae bacterium]|nr:hypothetical protein [Holophagaceae bacterium]
MVMGRLKGAVSDVAETLRRVFSAPPCHSLDPSLDTFNILALEPFEGRILGPDFLCRAELVQPELGLAVRVGLETVAFQPRVQGDSAFSAWAAGAQVCEMPVFGDASGVRSQIPPLPRRANVRNLPLDAPKARSRGGLETVSRPRTFQAEPTLQAPKVRRDLELALGLPMAILGEDPQQLPKPLWMRYTLQIVKATGENIRNLDVLGIYRIPTKGVTGLRHDARTGRLVIQLGSAASGAPRAPFILARRKDDRTIVSCYLEGG